MCPTRATLPPPPPPPPIRHARMRAPLTDAAHLAPRLVARPAASSGPQEKGARGVVWHLAGEDEDLCGLLDELHLHVRLVALLLPPQAPPLPLIRAPPHRSPNRIRSGGKAAATRTQPTQL